ncbi:MAG TPA: isochorismatase family cysteine hydrolase [Pseudothermotoga sp.]
MRALIVIDVQNDFVQKNGALYFTGAERVIAPVVDLVEKAIEDHEVIVTTQDWHDPDDAEFAMWPVHCVKNTHGAEIVEPIKKQLEGYERYFKIYKTRYSAFYGTNLDEILNKFSITEVDVCGVVTHICVFFTVEELRNRGIEVTVHEKAIASYDSELHRFAIRMMREILGAEVI